MCSSFQTAACKRKASKGIKIKMQGSMDSEDFQPLPGSSLFPCHMRPTQFRSSGTDFKASVHTRRPPSSDSAIGRAWQFRCQLLQVCAVLPSNCLPALANDEKRQASECGFCWSCLHGGVLRSSCSMLLTCWFYPQTSTMTAAKWNLASRSLWHILAH